MTIMVIPQTKKVNVDFRTYGKFWIINLLSTLVQLLHYILKCNYFGMTTVSFLSKLLASLMRNYFPKGTSGASLHTLFISYDVPVGFVSPLFLSSVLLWLRSLKGGCCSISACLVLEDYTRGVGALLQPNL